MGAILNIQPGGNQMDLLYIEYVPGSVNDKTGKFFISCVHGDWRKELDRRGVEAKGKTLNEALLHYFDKHTEEVKEGMMA